MIAAGDVPASETNSPEEGEEGSSRPPQRSSGSRLSLWERMMAALGIRNGSSLRDDLADALDEHTRDTAAFSPGERAMLKNILRLRELRVEDVMVPRADIEAVDLNTTLGDGGSSAPVALSLIVIRVVVAHGNTLPFLTSISVIFGTTKDIRNATTPTPTTIMIAG